jgi:hypothetical protein
MCENCLEIRDEALKKVYEFLDPDSEPSQELAKASEGMRDRGETELSDEEREASVRVVRYQLAAEALALATSAENTPLHGDAMHHVMSKWTMDAMRHAPLEALTEVLEAAQVISGQQIAVPLSSLFPEENPPAKKVPVKRKRPKPSRNVKYDA